MVDVRLEELLGRLERLEDPFLSWGIVGVVLAEAEVDWVIEAWLEEGDSLDDPLDVVDDLIDGGLLIKVDGGYRTRIGELLWEVANLRQLFPERDDPEGPAKNWRSSPTLVDGFRFTRRPREYPRRDRDPTPLMERLTRPDTASRDVFRQMTTRPDGGAFLLGGFQERATDIILGQARRKNRTTGAIVGAGTGSGKTMAFYLPALTHIAATLDGGARLRALALYPRNELLKDQLQSGVEQAVRLAATVETRCGRPLRVGALFGDVPQNLSVLGKEWFGSWRRRGDRRVCPYLVCPGSKGDGCGGELTIDGESHSDEPALRCDQCGHELSPEIFPVTRAQMRRRPPDLLYCSTEMLNRSLLDPGSAPLLGIDTKAGPDLVLLDEVHTYGGTSGAMTALAIRRWRNRVNSNPAFVGLSATLMDAPRFFADLVGLHADQVVDIRPDPEELIPEGAEYQLVVRGDATSGAGLLSTTIQTSMLIGRAMDGGGRAASGGLFGSKVFVFTDDLDVTNRLYFNTLDAEGQRHRRGGGVPYKPSLAYVRAATHPDTAARRRAGQVWDLASATGHSVEATSRLRVARTSSQDAGLDGLAQIVVATASLEVGVDDPGVGAVIQHKAPRDNAAFLQRQGRAGRQRGTRPLTAVVLSDYGRDRETYESWDQLLSPLLRPSSLPIRNVHVLRMQAVLASFGWAVTGASGLGEVNLWTALSGPTKNEQYRRAQQEVASRFRSLLTDESARDSLAAHLSQALGVEPQVAQGLLWEPPRPLILGAIPALLRRLSDGWQVATANEMAEEREDEGARQPLPEFVPPTLFSPLALPEVMIELPTPTGGDPTRPKPIEALGLVQALRELAPGRVTKRFAVDHDLDRAWVAADPEKPTIDIDDFVDVFQRDGDIHGVELLRPLRLHTEKPDTHLLDSSNGRPNWVSELRPRAAGIELVVPDGDPMSAVVRSFAAHLHRDHRQVEALRGAASSDVSLLFRDGREERFVLDYERAGRPTLLGGAFDVDALRFRVVVTSPPGLWNGPLGSQTRTAYLRDELTARLRGPLNPFAADWVHEVVAGAILREAIEQDCSLHEAWSTISQDLSGRLEAALELLLAGVDLDLGDGDTTSGPRKLRERLAPALESPTVQEILARTVPVLWEDPDANADAWVNRRMARTVGEVLMKGAALLCPEHDPDTILLDLVEAADGFDVWVSEQVVGGGGFLEAVVDACTAEPDRIFRLAQSSLRPGIEEVIDSSLETVAGMVAAGGDLAEAFAPYRAAQTAGERATKLHQLREAMADAGVPAMPDVVGAVANRLLRPGSSAETDRLIAESLADWIATEERLGVEVPLRTWAFLDSVKSGARDIERFEKLNTALWPRGAAPRDRRYASYNPFATEPDPAPAILQVVLEGQRQGVVVVGDAEASWIEVATKLQQDGRANLVASRGARSEFLDLLVRTATEPIVLDHLRVQGRVVSLDLLADGDARAALELPMLGGWRGGSPAQAPESAVRSRRLMTTGGGRMTEVEHLHHLFFLTELVQPSSPLWIVSAWLSDLTVIDNRGGELSSVAPGLPARRLGIVEVLTEFVGRGGNVRVVVNDDSHNRSVTGQLEQLSHRTTPGSVSVEIRRDLHDKTMVGERMSIEGSMNLTHSGSMRNEEGVRVVTDRADIAEQRAELLRRFGASVR